jgi:hypothetical protein
MEISMVKQEKEQYLLVKEHHMLLLSPGKEQKHPAAM